jgi:hypothetical protein
LVCVFVVATILNVSNVTGSKRAPLTAFSRIQSGAKMDLVVRACEGSG